MNIRTNFVLVLTICLFFSCSKEKRTSNFITNNTWELTSTTNSSGCESYCTFTCSNDEGYRLYGTANSNGTLSIIETENCSETIDDI